MWREIRDKAGSYDPTALYESDGRIRRVLDALVDGTLDDGGTGMFHDLFDSILKGASWHRPDQYYLLLDFGSYLDENPDKPGSPGPPGLRQKGWLNICCCGRFSSDRAIREYAEDIWKIAPVRI